MSTFTPNITADEAAEQLREMLADDPTVYVVQRRVSASGMNRKLSLFALDASDGTPELVDVTVKVAAVLGYKVHDVGGFSLSVNGAGMDMHWHVVYQLSSSLYYGDHSDKSDRAGYVLRKVTL